MTCFPTGHKPEYVFSKKKKHWPKTSTLTKFLKEHPMRVKTLSECRIRGIYTHSSRGDFHGTRRLGTLLPTRTSCRARPAVRAAWDGGPLRRAGLVVARPPPARRGGGPRPACRGLHLERLLGGSTGRGCAGVHQNKPSKEYAENMHQKSMQNVYFHFF